MGEEPPDASASGSRTFGPGGSSRVMTLPRAGTASVAAPNQGLQAPGPYIMLRELPSLVA